MLRCHKEEIPLNIPLFKSIFMFKNSATTNKGWVSIQYLPGVQHIMNATSFSDSIHNWKYHIVILNWKGGDWGQFFVFSFNHVVDPGYFLLELNSSGFMNPDTLLMAKLTTEQS